MPLDPISGERISYKANFTCTDDSNGQFYCEYTPDSYSSLTESQQDALFQKFVDLISTSTNFALNGASKTTVSDQNVTPTP